MSRCDLRHDATGLIDRISCLDAVRLPAMDAQKPRLPLLEQREIEARIVGPLVRAFASQLGIERSLAIVGEVVRDLARREW